MGTSQNSVVVEATINSVSLGSTANGIDVETFDVYSDWAFLQATHIMRAHTEVKP